MNIEELKAQTLAGLHIRSDAQILLPEMKEASINFYLDLIRYSSFYFVRRWLNTEFANSFDALPIEAKAEIAKLDAHHILPARVLSELTDQDYTQWLNSPNLMLSEMASAIAIVNANLEALNKSDETLLYQYFVNSRIEPKDIAHFSSDSFIRSTLNKLLTEQRVIFTWIVQNLISMTQGALINPLQHKDFFLELFQKESYIQGELSRLFNVAVAKEPNLFEELTKCRLSIDPFTKQVDHSLWLRDGAKFLYLEEILSQIEMKSTEQIAAFKHKLKIFKEINKFDRSLSLNVGRSTVSAAKLSPSKQQ